MAVLTNPTVLYQNTDAATKVILLAFRKVTTGDTFDLAPYGFNTVFGGLFGAETLRTAAAVVSGIAGTVITASSTGVAGDGGFLFAYGD